MDAAFHDLLAALVSLRRSIGLAQDRLMALLAMVALFGIVTTAIGLIVLLVRSIAARTLAQGASLDCRRLGTC